MKRILPTLVAMLSIWVFTASSQSSAYPGFDRNDYPGDQNLKELHETFAYSGYWLNNPPGETHNNWHGKRKALRDAGFGFLVLFNGRLYADLKTVSRAKMLGKEDGREAITMARKEGFPAKAIIFLDQEQGGRMLPEQKAYIYAWVDQVSAAGFLAGIYCSGIPAQESAGVSVVTANDIRENSGGRKIAYFVTNDACPPSPGCVFRKDLPSPAASGIGFADIWQFAQSPRRKDVAAGCKNYNPDGECYPPGIDAAAKVHADLDVATSADPSNGR